MIKLLDVELKKLNMKQLSRCEDYMKRDDPVLLHEVMKWCSSPKGMAATLIEAGFPKDRIDEVFEKVPLSDIQMSTMKLSGYIGDDDAGK